MFSASGSEICILITALRALGSSPSEIELKSMQIFFRFLLHLCSWLTCPALLFFPLHFRAKWFIFSQLKTLFFPKAGQFRLSWTQFPHSVINPLAGGFDILSFAIVYFLKPPSSCRVLLACLQNPQPVLTSLTCCCVCLSAGFGSVDCFL